jgi:hypothetical protein
LILEGEVELANLIDIDDSIADFSKIDNDSVLPESEAKKSFDQGRLMQHRILTVCIESKQIVPNEREPDLERSK